MTKMTFGDITLEYQKMYDPDQHRLIIYHVETGPVEGPWAPHIIRRNGRVALANKGMRRTNNLIYPKVIYPNELEQRFNIKPLPCPFCGNSNVVLYIGPNPHITCTICNADGPFNKDKILEISEKQFLAIKLWNKRI